MKEFRLQLPKSFNVFQQESSIQVASSEASSVPEKGLEIDGYKREIELWNEEELLRYNGLASGDRTKSLGLEERVVVADGKGSEKSSENGIETSWLRERCEKVVAASENCAMSAPEMALGVISMLSQVNVRSEELQGELFDLLAGDFEAVIDVLGKRDALVKISDAVVADCTQAQELHVAGVRPGPSLSARTDTRGFGPVFSVTDARQVEADKRRKYNEKRAMRAGLLPTTAENDFRGPGSKMQELQKAFPGIQLDESGPAGGIDHMSLPSGSTTISGDGYEEVDVPPPRPTVSKPIPLVHVADTFAECPEVLTALKGVTTLNRLQSTVYPMAFKSNENLLVCAPTGAGKTNVALLTILREYVAVKERRQSSFKVVYVAPMKALAAEVVEKFGKRLNPLGLRVREYTGDMSLTRQEALETQILVTTPEKWDVVTRKAGSELSDTVTLFIVDEIHLLHDDRGAVLESIVARTLRLSEAAQRVIRLVGLSATLPNYKDVGTFMRVNPTRGLFYFDSSYRPVPLSQSFVGITAGGSSNSSAAVKIRNAKMTKVAYDKVVDSLTRGHQAMVFVHSRKQTSSTARDILELAAQDGFQAIFLGNNTFSSSADQMTTINEGKEANKYPKSRRADRNMTQEQASLPSWAATEVAKSRTKDIRDLCSKGIGIHHAGLPRVDRKLVERLFADGVIRLLCCTATLAWGINLPARTVVIKGTEVYDSDKGAFVQLGMLDVTQIFGRAGRPQYDTFGEATIITSYDNLAHYLKMLTSAVPIESTLSSNASILADHLNAEIVSGTVNNIGSGVQWLSYTYLSVRMPLNPLAYGINWADVYVDPLLNNRRSALITSAVKLLDDAGMTRYDPKTGSVTPTDLGRVASHYYVSHRTVVLWNELLADFSGLQTASDETWSEIDSTIVHAVASASEFEQIRVREEEMEELDALAAQCPIALRSLSSTREGKVAILLECFISKIPLTIPDLSYVTQSATRLLRALFEICLRRGLPFLTLAALELARASESRVWPFQNPLHQFRRAGQLGLARGTLSREALMALDHARGDTSIKTLRTASINSLISTLGSRQHASSIMMASKLLPTLEILSATSRPVSRTAVEVDMTLSPSFTWKESLHGSRQSFWLWIEDLTHHRIYHSEQILLQKGRNRMFVSVTVPVFDPPSPEYTIRLESSTFHTDGGSSWTLSLAKMHLPKGHAQMTQLQLSLRPLAVRSCLPQSVWRHLQRVGAPSHLGLAETQCFHRVRYGIEENVLVLGAPEHSALTMAEVGVLAGVLHFRERSGTAEEGGIRSRRMGRVLYLKQTRDGVIAAKQRLEEFGLGTEGTNLEVSVTTPVQLYEETNGYTAEEFRAKIHALVIDEIHRMHENPILEALLIRARITEGVRIVATGAVMAGVHELADWLGVTERNLFVFDWASRVVPIERHVLGVAGERYAARMVTMNRMVYSALVNHGRDYAVVFVATRRQVRETAMAIRRLAAADGNPERFVRVHGLSHNFQDLILKEVVESGISFMHSGLSARDAESVTRLVMSGSVSVVIATVDCADRICTSNVGLVVVKGTDLYDIDQGRYVQINAGRITSFISRAGSNPRAREGFAYILTEERRKTALRKFLFEPLYVESRLIDILPAVLCNEIARGRLHTFQDAVDYLTWSYYFRRLIMNPSYYGLLKPSVDFDRLCRHLSKEVETAVMSLIKCRAIEVEQKNPLELVITEIGRRAALGRLRPASISLIRNALQKISDPSTEDVLQICSSLGEFPRISDRQSNVMVDRAIDVLVRESYFSSKRVAVERLGLESKEVMRDRGFIVLQILLCYIAGIRRWHLETNSEAKDVLARAHQILKFVTSLAELEGREKWLEVSRRILRSFETRSRTDSILE